MAEFVGVPPIRGASAVAKAAIRHASDRDATFYLLVDDVGRAMVRRVGRTLGRVPSGWVATFDYDSDPDWLAEEIEGVASA